MTVESYLKSSIISVHGAEHPRLGRRIVNLHRGPLVRVHLLLLGERAVQRLLSGDGLDAFDAAVPAHPLYPISVEEHLISLLLDRVLLVASLHPVWIKRRGRNGTSVSARLLARGVSSRSPVSVIFWRFSGWRVGGARVGRVHGAGLTRCSPPSWYRVLATWLFSVPTQTRVSLRRSVVTTAAGSTRISQSSFGSLAGARPRPSFHSKLAATRPL